MIRVLVVDDHPVVRAGLQLALGARGDLRVVGEAADGEEALRLAEALRPDVVLLDCRLPGMNGIAVAQALREQCPAVRVVALSAYEDEGLVLRMLEAGAVGYVLKDEPLEGILAAVRAAARGKAYFSPEVVAKVTAWAQGRRPGGLTEREWEVLRWMAEGKSNREIARALFVSEHTVEKHVGRILEKLGMKSRVEVVRWAVEKGFVG
ncbi:MAG: response regulator transcription factor [Thermoflexales bacterium]|nr:response regulator transcription factor [Thermoflexales bacterium]